MYPVASGRETDIIVYADVASLRHRSYATFLEEGLHLRGENTGRFCCLVGMSGQVSRDTPVQILNQKVFFTVSLKSACDISDFLKVVNKGIVGSEISPIADA